MIEVSVSERCLKVCGHANYRQKGSDIVCSGVSTLTYTLLQSLETFSKDNIEVIEEEGITILKYEDLSDTAKLLIDSFFIGILGIMESYPEYVKLAS